MEVKTPPTKDLDSKEFRTEQGQSLIHYLDKVHAERTLGKPGERQKFLSSLTTEEGIDWMTRINGIVMEKPISQRAMDGASYVALQGMGQTAADYIPPRPERRLQLMKEIIEAIKDISDPKDQAYALGIAINLIHPFNDGNGRTSRIVSSLIRVGMMVRN